jgi:hypothetical protein
MPLEFFPGRSGEMLNLSQETCLLLRCNIDDGKVCSLFVIQITADFFILPGDFLLIRDSCLSNDYEIVRR